MATTKLTRTETAGNRQIWTFSAWVKRSTITTTDGQYLFSSSDGSNNYNYLQINPSDQLRYLDYTSGNNSNKITTQLFRDCGGYYHIVCAVDTTDGVAEDRVKLYVNGERITAFGTNVNHGASDNTEMNVNTYTMSIGSDQTSGGGQYWVGLMSNVAFVDGTALSPTSFGETDSTSGIWKFKPPSGLTWGTNGFWLKGENSAALGTDSSGETNTLTTSGSPTQSIDTPSNVYCTFNSLDNIFNDKMIFSNANNTVNTYSTGSSVSQPVLGNMGVSKGKWYWETKWVSHSSAGTGDYSLIGITSRIRYSNSGYQHLGATSDDYAYYGYNGNLMNNTGSSNTGTAYGNTYTTGDIIGVAMDLDNNKLYFSKNGTWQDSGDPTSGASGTGAVSITEAADTPDRVYYAGVSDYHYAPSYVFSNNFGAGYFGTTAVSSAGTSSTDDDSIWEYDCPTGYYGLNTKNINTYG